MVPLGVLWLSLHLPVESKLIPLWSARFHTPSWPKTRNVNNARQNKFNVKQVHFKQEKKKQVIVSKKPPESQLRELSLPNECNSYWQFWTIKDMVESSL